MTAVSLPSFKSEFFLFGRVVYESEAGLPALNWEITPLLLASRSDSNTDLIGGPFLIS